MKRTSLLIAAAIVIGVSFGPGIAVPPAEAQARGGKVILPPGGPLSDAEKSALVLAREEEKFMRDLYLTLNAKWQSPPLYTIAAAEQNHTDIVEKLLAAYRVPDPVVNESAIGVFLSPYLQEMYPGLITQGQTSFIEALKVGAYVEEGSIRDLDLAIDASQAHVDIVTVYQHLMECSKNHLRAFVSCLAKQGIVYSPRLLDPALYAAIIAIRD